VAGHRFLHQARELARTAHALAVELDDDVGLLHAGSVSRRVGADLFDNGAACHVLTVGLGLLNIADRDPDLRAAAREHGQGTGIAFLA
jgi:hypothetical protein